jgi:lipoprotein-anchoring transpeptidase ErfK/SrfK
MNSIKLKIIMICALFGAVIIGYTGFSGHYQSPAKSNISARIVKASHHKNSEVVDAASNREQKPKFDWKKPSETKAYPDLKENPDSFIRVSIDKQQVYIQKGEKVLYTMNAATGQSDSPTPKGTFEIQNRGDKFYNASSKEGANYWTSFKDWGVYLFHTVPTDENGTYLTDEAEKLGTPSSHGCVRLSIPDAKWINENVPSGMKVIVE